MVAIPTTVFSRIVLEHRDHGVNLSIPPREKIDY